ncbi:MAG: DDE-type integrase/transposase/recombinase [Chitinophagaceae bacterium]
MVKNKSVYLLTIMDVFTRTVLAHVLRPSIKQQNVILLPSGIADCYNTKDIIIRNDNGSQFIAHSVRKYLKDVGMSQEFTHIATPQENAYIEALHSTLENDVIQRYWFDSIHHAAMKIKDNYRVYNTK